MSTPHLPDRTSWDCASCGAPWPCEPARTRLLQTMGPTSLGMYAAAQLYDAVPQLPDVSPAELWVRFLGWIRTTEGARPGVSGNSAETHYRRPRNLPQTGGHDRD